jgi:hypothetical protein
MSLKEAQRNDELIGDKPSAIKLFACSVLTHFNVVSR